MTPEEEAAFTEKLAKQFILIPKERLYHVIGGALAFLVAALGINMGTVVAYLRTKPAERERGEIHRIYVEVQEHYKNLGVGTFLTREEASTFFKNAETNFLKRGDAYYIKPMGSSLALHVHDDHFVNGAEINLSSDAHQTWNLVPAGK